MPSSDEERPRRFRLRLTALAAVCVVVPGALLAAVSHNSGSGSPPGTLSPADLRHLPEPGSVAPLFALRDFDGHTVSLAAYRGRPVIVTFFASWCNPCEKETPLLERARREHAAEHLGVLGVMFNDREADARAFLSRLGAHYPALVDPEGNVARAYGVQRLPITFFIGPDGKVVARGFGLTQAKWLNPPLQQLLAHP